MHPGIVELLNFTRKQLPEGRLSLFTNGSRMTEELLFLCKRQRITLSTSLQGLRTYGAMIGTRRKYYKTLKLLYRAAELQWPFSVSMTVTRINRSELSDMIIAAAVSGASSLQIGAVMPEGRARNRLDLTLSREEWAELKAEIQKRDYGIPYTFCDEMICECRDQPAEFLARFQPPFFLLAPVMGDHGRLYSSVSEKHCEGLKKLAAEADVLTPNLTEAFLLSGMPYCEAPSKELLILLLQKLQVLCPSGKIVITGITGEKGITNLIFENGLATPCTLPYAGASRPGTGDIFASVLAGELMKQKALPLSVAKAADFVARCIENSELCATPIQEGVCLENCLPLLLES